MCGMTFMFRRLEIYFHIMLFIKAIKGHADVVLIEDITCGC